MTTANVSTLVYRYGCPSSADLSGEAMEQLRLAHMMSNDCVEIERHADRLRARTESKARRRTVNRARKACLKMLRQRYAALGLHWGTYNAVLDRNEVARKAVIRRRTERRPAERKYRRWDGTGTLAAQVQYPTGRPPRLSGTWRLDVDPTPRRGGRKWATAHITLGHGNWLSLPINYHRPIPPGAEIRAVEVTRRRVAGSHRLSVAVTVRMPTPSPRPAGSAVAVRTGWRSGRHGVQVATIHGAHASIPADLADVVLPTHDGGHVVVMPGQWIEVMRRTARIRGHRDDLLNGLRPLVVAALRDGTGIAETLDLRSSPSTWRSPRRFAWLASRWPDDHPLAPTLQRWTRRDRHLWEFERHESDQIIARRRDAWRKVAAWLCEEPTSMVAIHDLPIDRLREADTDSGNRWAAAGGRRNIQTAAPGELRAAVAWAAEARGVRAMTVTERENAA